MSHINCRPKRILAFSERLVRGIFSRERGGNAFEILPGTAGVDNSISAALLRVARSRNFPKSRKLAANYSRGACSVFARWGRICVFARVPFSAGDERHAQQSLFVFVGQAEDKKGEEGEGRDPFLSRTVFWEGCTRFSSFDGNPSVSDQRQPRYPLLSALVCSASDTHRVTSFSKCPFSLRVLRPSHVLGSLPFTQHGTSDTFKELTVVSETIPRYIYIYIYIGRVYIYIYIYIYIHYLSLRASIRNRNILREFSFLMERDTPLDVSDRPSHSQKILSTAEVDLCQRESLSN